MNEISRYVPITRAKNDLLELIRQVENLDESVAVTKNGVPAAVILSMEKYAGLIETLEILSDEDTAKSLRLSYVKRVAVYYIPGFTSPELASRWSPS